jgi:hypothetical protein
MAGKTEIHIYDFDGTLFRSPKRPDWWPTKGWWGQPASLTPPCVPQKPGSGWWNGSVVSSAKRSISDSDVWAMMVTGRADGIGPIRWRVAELLKQKGLNFDEVHLNTGGGTESYKKKIILKTLAKYPHVEVVQIWEDRGNHLSSFCKVVESTGRICIPHHIREVNHPVDCALEDYENVQKWANQVTRVAGRWVRNLSSS